MGGAGAGSRPHEPMNDSLRETPSDDRAALGPLDAAAEATLDAVAPHTMTGPSRVVALVDAIRYVAAAGIPGALVECGVWRGGSSLAMVRTLLDLGIDDRRVLLYDTFEGMTEPTARDTSSYSPNALELWEQSEGKPGPIFNGPASEEAVRELLLGSGYPAAMIELVAGPVERTLPEAAPDRIAILRLDTDWYESTLHELRHLYPRLSSGGVLIVDDYGHWDGARAAVEEYFGSEAEPVLLQRVDYTARIAIKR